MNNRWMHCWGTVKWGKNHEKGRAKEGGGRNVVGCPVRCKPEKR